MSLKETVYKISRHPALGPVGRAFYFLCERLLTHTFKGFAEIRSAYVAGSMAEGDIAPGLSDIDCVITIDDLRPGEEYRLMTELERKIRYRMPPFGKDKIGVHVVAYSSAEWSLLGDLFLGKKAGRPRALFRRNEKVPDYKLNRRVKTLHHLYKAIWKIINLEDNVIKPFVSPLDAELANRIIDRTIITLDYAVEEARNPSGGYSDLRQSVLESWETAKEGDDDFKYTDMTAALLHLFDVAAEAVSVTERVGLDSPGSLDTAGEAVSMPTEIADIMPVIHEHRRDRDRILYALSDKKDIFLFDPENRELTVAILKYYKGVENRFLRIMSGERFEQFLLNFSEQAAVDVCDGESYILRGPRDYDALLLDVYSILPQLRSPGNCKSRERYEAFRAKAVGILRTLEASGLDGGKHSDPEEPFGRFTGLRELSQALTAGLGKLLSPERSEAHD
jgi:predicted nucleotidyltransferase